MSRRGFTLIEILLVVVIIGILSAMTVPSYQGRAQQARGTAARTDIEANLATALDLYWADNGAYPTTAQGLPALIETPDTAPIPEHWNGPYLKKRQVPKDPWGHEYRYVCPGEHNKDSYDLSSNGPDGIPDSDDVANWAEPSS